jgi:hypothetical protein
MTYTDYDDERIPCIGLADRTHRARKEHKCSGGKHTIKPGEAYRYRFYILDGEPVSEKLCLNCEAEIYLL